MSTPILLLAGAASFAILYFQPWKSDDAGAGRALFAANCAGCHGADAGGAAEGPPLTRRTDAPGPLDDAAFRRAVGRGSDRLRWKLGPMAAMPGIDDADLALIIAHVRGLQHQNGIE